MAYEIESVDEYVRWVFETLPGGSETAFYRGHSDAADYKLRLFALRTDAARVAEPM